MSASRSGHENAPAASPAPGPPPRPVGPSTAEHLEQIIEIADIHLALGPVLPPLRALGMRPIGMARPLGAAFVDLAAIVAGALLRIRQDDVGGRDRLEARLGGRLPRGQIVVKLLGELAVGLADLVGGGGRLCAAP